jgi:hypothetical protein
MAKKSVSKKSRKSAKKRSAKRNPAQKRAQRRSGKGHIPLAILERRAKKLVAIVKSRGGKVG